MSTLGPKKPRLDLGGDADESSSNAPRVVAVASTDTVELPLLTKANYHEWSLVMKVPLEAMELWDAVEADCKECAKDRPALAAVLHAVPSEMKVELAVKKSVKEAWEAVKKMRVGDDRVKSVSVQRLVKEFENVAFRDGESVDDFAMRINGLVASLRELGEAMEDSHVVKKILRVVPKKFKLVAVAIEMFTDFNTTSAEEVVGRPCVAEDVDVDEAVDGIANSIGRLLLTEEQWEARRRRGKARTHGGGGDKGGVRDEDDGSSSVHSDSSSQRKFKGTKGKCYNCGVHGHFAEECPKKRKEQALFAGADEELSLL
ncbi:unnamed protein product [Urochloa humidicola]